MKYTIPQPIGTTNESARHGWVHDRLAAIPAGARLLDAGAGMQRYRANCKHLEYVAQDFAQYDGQGDGKGGQVTGWKHDGLDIVSDITAIPEPDASFDAVLCTEVFEHVPDPISALRELARLLRPGGTLILTAPFVSNTHYSPYHFCTGFSRYFYEQHLAESGLVVESIDTNGSFFDVLAQELRRVPWVANRYCNRRPGLLLRAATALTLRGIDRLARHDQGSDEYLAFGLQVVAHKPAQAAHDTHSEQQKHAA
ncbi:MAG: methyltransferase domain-containing protein [Planctomycetota bacterium]